VPTVVKMPDDNAKNACVMIAKKMREHVFK
jgi:hypothetical protein